MRAVIAIVIGLAAGVLGYGYWHRSSHTTLTVVLTDASKKEHDGRLLNAELVFLDASSRPLARGKTDDKLGIVLFQHPDSGYCGPDLSLEVYRACVIAQSGWLTGWVNDLRYVSVVIGNCRIERVPVEVTMLRDSLFTWWIPLGDWGGTPYTRYATRLEVDVRVCAVTGYRGRDRGSTSRKMSLRHLIQRWTADARAYLRRRLHFPLLRRARRKEDWFRDPQRALASRLLLSFRAYRLYLPAAASNRSDLPLLVMLHGCKQDALVFAEGTRMNQLAERYDFIVLYPEQSRRANPFGCWNWFQPAVLLGSGEAATIARIVRRVIKRYPFNDPRGPDASQLVWDFLKEFRRSPGGKSTGMRMRRFSLSAIWDRLRPWRQGGRRKTPRLEGARGA